MRTKTFLIGLMLLIGGIMKAQDIAIPKGSFLFDFGYSAPNVAQAGFSTIGDGTDNGSSSPYYVKLGYAFLDKNVFGIYGNFSSGSTGNVDWEQTNHYPNGRIYYTDYSYYYTMLMFTYGVEYAHHFGKNPKLSPYYGLMLGYTQVLATTNGTVPTSGDILTVSGSFFTYQAYLGATWYFVPSVGLEGRVSFGNSYYASIGVSCKFGGHKSTSTGVSKADESSVPQQTTKTATIQPTPVTPASSIGFQVGDKVAVNKNGNWITGSIIGVTQKGTYLIKWDDTGKIDEVDGKDITKVQK